jgi:hypothetical protein
MLARNYASKTERVSAGSIRRASFLAGREFGPGIVANAGTRACMQRWKKLALAELEALAGAFLPVLLALPHA